MFSFNDRLDLPSYPSLDITLESTYVSEIKKLAQDLNGALTFFSFIFYCSSEYSTAQVLGFSFLYVSKKPVFTLKSKILLIASHGTHTKGTDALEKIKVSETTSELAFYSNPNSRQEVGSVFVEM